MRSREGDVQIERVSKDNRDDLLWRLFLTQYRRERSKLRTRSTFERSWHHGLRMIAVIDIWRAADLLLQKHNAEAEIVAAQRADLMLGRGDRDGQMVWMRIRRAIIELQAPQTGPAY